MATALASASWMVELVREALASASWMVELVREALARAGFPDGAPPGASPDASEGESDLERGLVGHWPLDEIESRSGEGDIDDVRIYDRALSPAEVRALATP